MMSAPSAEVILAERKAFVMKSLRLSLIYFIAKVLRVPIRIGDEWWMADSKLYAPFASQSLSDEQKL